MTEPTPHTALTRRGFLARSLGGLLVMGLDVVPMGSVAYKMARVAAGLDDATWTLVPKHEWDVAAGAALLPDQVPADPVP